jgi:hypothetical protein
MPSPPEWIPHAEKEFGHFTHALSKRLPAKLTQMRRAGKLAKALTATTPRKGKG